MDYFLNFKVNKTNFKFDVKSKSFNRGKNVCIFKNSIFNNKKLIEHGYTINKFPNEYYNNIKKSITNFISKKLNNPQNFELEDYHKFVDDAKHKEVVNSFRAGNLGTNGIDLSELGIPYQTFNEFINNTIDSNLSCHYKRDGLSIKNFWLRIVRPNKKDNNPPHKDVHVKRICDNINIYLPLAGSNHNSSLPIIPKSHLENESNYIISDSPCYVNGIEFTVPSIVHRDDGINLITPNPQCDEIMIFTPYLIHGGGVNLNTNMTRVSLEMRFFN